MVRVGVVVKVAVLSAALIAVNKSEILLRLSEARASGSAWWPQRVAKHKGLLIYGCRSDVGPTGVVHPRYHSIEIKGAERPLDPIVVTLESSWHMFYTYFTNENGAIIYMAGTC